MSNKEFTPFDFMNAVSDSKKDIIRGHENPEMAERLKEVKQRRGITDD